MADQIQIGFPPPTYSQAELRAADFVPLGGAAVLALHMEAFPHALSSTSDGATQVCVPRWAWRVIEFTRNQSSNGASFVRQINMLPYSFQADAAKAVETAFRLGRDKAAYEALHTMFAEHGLKL